MIYVLAAVNILWLLLLTSFVVYSIAKGAVVINYNNVLDKETSIEVANIMKEQFEQEINGGY